MKITLLIAVTIIHNANCVKTEHKSPPNNTVSAEDIKRELEKHQQHLLNISKNKTNFTGFVVTNMGKTKIIQPPEPEEENKITPEIIQGWANTIASKLHTTEEFVVRRKELLNGFVNVKSVVRDGAAIADKAAAAFTELLETRAEAAENIMRKAEELQSSKWAPKGYQFHYSYKLQIPKLFPKRPQSIDWYKVILLKCRSQSYIPVQHSSHFDADVSLELSSVHVAAEVFDCDKRVLQDMYWSEALDTVFRENYRKDASLGFQYFCSAKGFLRHFPAASWESMFKLSLDEESDDESATGVYDCRLRPWYVSAGGAPRDVLIMLDGSGSMYNSSNKVIAEQFTLALLSALTDDDHVNVLRFNVTVKPVISCFKDMLIPANHINSAAIINSMKYQSYKNATNMTVVLMHSVKMMKEQRTRSDRRPPCQQAIVLITDTLNENLTELMKKLDPEGTVRLFIIWLHDVNGLRDGTRQYSDQLSCTTDGYFAELVTHADVTDQVLRLLRVLERPLVIQRKERLRVFSDVYAHVEDPRRSEHYWTQKENEEQKYRYIQLRRNKAKLLNSSQLYKDYMHEINLDQHGQYYEGVDVNYRLQISVSVPVFENTTQENVTKHLQEEKARTSTRTYPVNRLLGVAGVDIPIDHMKLVLPFYRVGAGGILFIVDHRGSIVLHENLKPTFNGNILKPGYRTVDFLELEQAAENHLPRKYPPKWFNFRNRVIIDHPKGTETLLGKYIYEGGMRAIIEEREYTWRRVLNHYTVVVVLPRRRRLQAVPVATKFTQKMAEEALEAFKDPDFVVHPDWLYCRYVHKEFSTPEERLLEFVRRRQNEYNFAMKMLEHFFSPIPQESSELGKTYQCDEELVARVCADASATAAWSRRTEAPGANRSCSGCELGSVTAFITTESGLTRWQKYHVTSSVEPPEATPWARGAGEPWYARAAAADGSLVVHAPVVSKRIMRNSDALPPPIGERAKWLTAARILELPGKGMVGVTGYHFSPHHLEDVLESITNFPYSDDEAESHVRCNGDWSCLLIDDGGWVVAGGGVNEDPDNPEEPVRQHLATLYPAAMTALLKAKVFELNWIHDYQAVCFPPTEENVDNAGPVMPSILRSVWLAINAVIRATSDAITIILLTSYGRLVSSETWAEKEKRRKSIKKNYEREKFDHLYDDRVLVNRSHIAACDRSRPFYILHRGHAETAFKRDVAEGCDWPLVGALLPHTNLVLVAVYLPQVNNPNCMDQKYQKLPVDPMINQKVIIEKEPPPGKKKPQCLAASLACWRSEKPLPARAPHMTCFQHDYAEEEGYRQCGPWRADDNQPDEDDDDKYVEQDEALVDDPFPCEARYSTLSRHLLYLSLLMSILI
ncbi:voltage-dependent calcium channel subunit alpha-2/delta-4-like isoform X2 [Choristoneura fumiferana]|uniref:voltage-dependent calcium channel subunit alpha-2/delta-4-like isoform X1 n=2 Tax=Choristoneura fumiferana TaxID=7141 RepID=UPI003D15EA3F